MTDGELGLKAGLIWQLEKEIRQLAELRRSKRHRVDAALKRYWEHPDNVAARKQSQDAETAAPMRVHGYGVAEWLMPASEGWKFMSGDVHEWQKVWLDDLLEDARNNTTSLNLLRELLAAWMEQKTIPAPIRQAAAAFIRGEFSPKGKTGIKVTIGDYLAGKMLAAMVGVVHDCAGYPLKKGQTGSAFDLVATATGMPQATIEKKFKQFRLPKSTEKQ